MTPLPHKKLKILLEGIAYDTTGDIEETRITGLCSDSRKVRPGDLFAALKGHSTDGLNFLDQAVSLGCAALLVNRGWQENRTGSGNWPGTPIIEVDETKSALGYIAANYYEHPDRQVTMIGITGTNGKTTTSFMVESLLMACGRRPGVIGTVNYRYHDAYNQLVELEAPLTTPESPDLFALIRRMVDEGITHVVMEVSSHALAQSRLTGIGFDIAVFTNLSREHLDFHADMHHYFSSKRLLFTNYLKPDGRVVIMLDDEDGHNGDDGIRAPKNNWGRQMHEDLRYLFQTRENPPPIITCGSSSTCDIHPLSVAISLDGIAAEIISPAGSLFLKSPLIGAFNLRNMLSAIGIGVADANQPACMQKGLEEMQTIPGRLERITSENIDSNCPAVFVDYAHTPDALENVLDALHNLKPRRLVCVFGCGGDRDPGKRALMGQIAGQRCDVVLATSDNPRTEAPRKILAQVEQGLKRTDLTKLSAAGILPDRNGKGYDIIENRSLAIFTAIRYAAPGDVILISGKGHENYQISKNGKIFFDDRIEAEMHLQAKAGASFAWTLKWIQQITGGRLLNPFAENVTFSGISTDTRTLKAGNLFVALKGDNFDGSMFARKALEKGAAGLIINAPGHGLEAALDFQPTVPVLLVADTVVALGQMAGCIRRWHYALQVIAITGSSGKTTVKEMTGCILDQNHAILKTKGNFNNLIGLPLTLFGLKADHDFAVLEMGMNKPGEIASLTHIADPDIACIINIQEAHLEGLGDIHGVADAKNELFAGLKTTGKIAVNFDDEIVRSLAEPLTQNKISFGCHPDAFIRATNMQNLGENGMGYTLIIGDQSRPVTIKGLGSHNVTNSLAAAALAYGAGLGIDQICRGLETFTPFDKRTRVEVLHSGLKVLNDSYNANPSSMLAALRTLLGLKNDHRTVAVLGDMLELGAKSDQAHAALGKTVKELGIDFLATLGSQAENMVDSARAAGMAPAAARAFGCKKDLACWLQDLLQHGDIKAGDWLLIKGSRGMGMEEVLELLRNYQSTIKAAGN